jgi:hypothetical protein
MISQFLIDQISYFYGFLSFLCKFFLLNNNTLNFIFSRIGINFRGAKLILICLILSKYNLFCLKNENESTWNFKLWFFYCKSEFTLKFNIKLIFHINRFKYKWLHTLKLIRIKHTRVVGFLSKRNKIIVYPLFHFFHFNFFVKFCFLTIFLLVFEMFECLIVGKNQQTYTERVICIF